MPRPKPRLGNVDLSSRTMMSLPTPLRSAATHGGPFHGDDVLAGALLLSAFPDLAVVRTRDAAELARHDVVFDVGGRYDASTWRLDHHFKPEPRREDGTLLSSAGLLWQHASPLILERLRIPADRVEDVAREFEQRIVRVVDAIDTGTPRHAPPPRWFAALFSEMPAWDEQPASPDAAHRMLDEAYRRQVHALAAAIRAMAASVSDGTPASVAIDQIIADLDARASEAAAAGRAALERARTPLVALLRAHGASDEPLLLPTPAFPWGPIWFDAERTTGRRCSQVIFQDLDGNWVVRSVNEEAAEKEKRNVSRLPFPEPWAGLSGADLAQVTGLADAVFCHPKRFIAGFRSEQSAREAARRARTAVVDSNPS